MVSRTMKAYVKDSPGPGGKIMDLPVPSPGEGEVLIRVKAAAICGTDMHIHEWNSWAQGAIKNVPLVMGHEFSGEVVELGPGVKTLQEGDYVSGETHIPCGHCYQCLNGQQHICANLLLPGVDRDGCFAEYIAYPEMCAVKIPRTIAPELGAIMEPLGVGVNAVLEGAVGGKNIVVIGCGPIGVGIISVADALGAAKIFALDISEYRLALAEKCGAKFLINPAKNNPVQLILDETNSVGADAFFDASGNTDAIVQGFKFLRKGGHAHLVGLPSKPATIDLVPSIIFKEATVHGYHGRKMFQTWTAMMNLMDSGKVDLEPIVSHMMPLIKAEEAFGLVGGGNVSKVVLLP